MRLIAAAAAAWLIVIAFLNAPLLTGAIVAFVALAAAATCLVRVALEAARRRRFRSQAAVRARGVAPVHSLYPVPLPAATTPDEVDLILLQHYWTSREIAVAARATGVERDEAKARLITLLLDGEGVAIDRAAGAAVTDEERLHLIDRWESGVPLVEVAAGAGRSPWAVAELLLDRTAEPAPATGRKDHAARAHATAPAASFKLSN